MIANKDAKYTTAHIKNKPFYRKYDWVLVLILLVLLYMFPMQISYHIGHWLRLLIEGFNSGFKP